MLKGFSYFSLSNFENNSMKSTPTTVMIRDAVNWVWKTVVFLSIFWTREWTESKMTFLQEKAIVNPIAAAIARRSCFLNSFL